MQSTDGVVTPPGITQGMSLREKLIHSKLSHSKQVEV